MAAMVVIGALTYFGMTNPSTSLPDKCIFSNAFGCKDYQINETAAKLQMMNTFGQTIYTPTASCTNDNAGSCTCSVASEGTPNPAYIDPDGVLEIICDNPPDSPFDAKDKAKVKVSINYYKTPTGGYKQISLGEVYTTVQNE